MIYLNILLTECTTAQTSSPIFDKSRAHAQKMRAHAQKGTNTKVQATAAPAARRAA